MQHRTFFLQVALTLLLLFLVMAFSVSLSVQLSAQTDPEPTTPTGRIAFIGHAPAQDIYHDLFVMNADGSDCQRITDTEEREADTVLSPDGSQIAFMKDWDIYTVKADGSSEPTLRVEDAMFPSWSPDGSQIVYVSGRDYRLHIIDADGSDSGPIGDLAEYFLTTPDWSPDGTKFVVLGRPRYPNVNRYEVFTLNIDGTELRQLTDIGLSYYGFIVPKWSPDGSQIAFQDDGQIYVMDADGSNLRALTLPHSIYEFAWSPDGTQILSGSYNYPKLVRINLDDSEFEEITCDNYDIGYYRYPAWID